ncbi:uncharacterized protein [Littorina saxatilis]|uniref:uncharacterized protein n=1 Tax=Littorina saxatilis TaxID=31220 RepID=UPI0038B62F21
MSDDSSPAHNFRKSTIAAQLARKQPADKSLPIVTTDKKGRKTLTVGNDREEVIDSLPIPADEEESVHLSLQVDSNRNDEEVDPQACTDVSPVNMSQSTSVDPLELTRQLMAEGQLLGLEGAELRAFVLDQKEKQQTLDREEREREAERLERDAERQERDAERLRLERDAERQFQLEQLKIQNANQEGNRNNNSPGRIREDDGFKPKIPFLDDRDDIESWFHQFEHYARDCNLSDTAKASRVVYFLKGKARVIFSKLNEEDANDYDTLKHALYEGFQLTSEDYRKKFRQTKKSATDTYKEHITKLERYLDKWVELAECDQDVKDLKDLLVREQVLDTLPPDLAVHIRDRDPKSAKEIGMIANTYQQSRSNVKTSSTKKFVPKEAYSAKMKETTLAEKDSKKMYHTAVVHIDSPYFDSETEVTVMDDPIYPVLIGKWTLRSKKNI